MICKNMKEKIRKIIGEALKNMDIEISSIDIVIEIPKDSSNGDYSSNIALRLAPILHKKPLDIANEIVTKIRKDDFSRVEAKAPGFINFYFSPTYLLKELEKIANTPLDYFKLDINEGKKLAIEYTDANPFKVLHIGHLYSNTIGEAFSRLQEASGAIVKRLSYQGDVGLHVAKTLWGLEKKLKAEGKSFLDIEKISLTERVKYLGDAYVKGAEFYDYKEDLDARKEIADINYYIFYITTPVLEKKDFSKYEEVNMKEKYSKGRLWCLEYFETIYKRLGTKFDYYFFESEVGEAGLKVVLENVGKVFKKDDSVIIYEGDKKKNLHTRVFINKYGLPTYEAKEIGLALLKKERVDYDTSIIITANEQSGYFKVVMDAISKLDNEIAKTTKHYPHGIVRLPNSQKMSSRKGGVISAEWLLNETKGKVIEKMRSNEEMENEDRMEIAEKIVIGAIKYAFLKVGVGSDISFDFDKAISFDGDTGPYIQYVYSRCNSLLREYRDDSSNEICYGECLVNPYVQSLTRVLSRYRGVLLDSASTYSPSILCQYLFDLSQSFNSFYQNVRLSDMEDEERGILLVIVRAVMNTVEHGLGVLGIQVVEKM